MGFSPFFLNNRRNPQKGLELTIEWKVQAVDEWVEQLGTAAYRIRILALWKVYNIFNEVLLKPHTAAIFPKQCMQEKEWKQQKEDDHKKRGEEFEVEEIIDSRLRT